MNIKIKDRNGSIIDLVAPWTLDEFKHMDVHERWFAASYLQDAKGIPMWWGFVGPINEVCRQILEQS